MVSTELQGMALWRRQRARNLMDCYALGMEVLSGAWDGPSEGNGVFETLVRHMVEGLAGPEAPRDANGYYATAARLCGECAAACQAHGIREKAGLFRIYGAIFRDMVGTEG